MGFQGVIMFKVLAGAALLVGSVAVAGAADIPMKAPPMVERPIKMVGLTKSMRREREVICLPSLSSRAK